MKTNLTILAVSTVLAILGAELAIRALFSEATFRDQFLMWSSPLFLMEENGAIRHLPDQEVREVAVYEGEIEYDIRFRTNNFGFIDEIDYEPTSGNSDKRSVVFVGDSFTAGTGGGPWVAELRERVIKYSDEVLIYNLGLVGAGFEHFYKKP